MARIAKRKVKKPASVKPVKEVEPKVLRNYSRLMILAALILILALLAWKNKGLFVAAMVNNQPVFRVSLDRQLESRYGEQTLDEMVGEMLIRQAAAQNKIGVAPQDVDAKIADIEKTLGGQITLKDALAQQGDTIEDFRHRVELQLMLEKLTAGQTEVSDQEVTDYIDKNRTTMTATDEAGLQDEARKAVLSQKQNTVLRQYFADLKSKAKVLKFL